MARLSNSTITSNLGFNTHRTVTWANRPSASKYANHVIQISDIGTNGSLWTSNGTIWTPMGGEVTIASSGADSSITGSISETVLGTVLIPGGMMSSTGVLEMVTTWVVTNNANVKTAYVRYGTQGSGLSGTVFYQSTANSTVWLQALTVINNDNSVSAQKGFGFDGFTPSGCGYITAAMVTTSFDTSNNTELNFSAKLTNSSDTFTLSGYHVTYRG